MIPWSYFSLCVTPLHWCGGSLPPSRVLGLSLWAPSAVHSHVSPVSHLGRMHGGLLRRNYTTLARFLMWVWFFLQSSCWGRRLSLAALQAANALHNVGPYKLAPRVLALEVGAGLPSLFANLRWLPRGHAQKFLPYFAFFSLFRGGLFVLGSLDKPLIITTATDFTWFFLAYFSSRNNVGPTRLRYKWVTGRPHLDVYIF